MRILVVSGTVLLGLAIAGALVSRAILNPRVVRELRQHPHGERARTVMLLSLPSGKTIPVNYLRDGATVYAAADFPWWRELRGEARPVELWIRGETLRGRARAVEDEPALRARVFDRLRPTAPRWTGTLVEIRLEPAPTGSAAPSAAPQAARAVEAAPPVW
jgi:hypothetical protein